MSKSTYKRIESVSKACDILGILAEAKEPLSGNEVAVRVQMSVGTVMCHLATLQDNGFVQEAGGGWRPGMKLSLFWARKKAELEGERARIDRDLEQLGGN